MTDNETFLAELTAWLRDRLVRAAGPEPRAPEPRPAALFRRRPPEPVPPGGGPSGSVPPVLADAERAEHPVPLVRLAERLGLSEFERAVLLLAVAMEIDTRIAPLCARAQHDPRRPYPTFALAMTLFDDAAWDAMSPERPLRRWQLLDLGTARTEPLTVSRLRAEERVVDYVKGLDRLDARLAPLLRPLPGPVDGDLSPTQVAAAAAVTAAVRRAATDGRASPVQLAGVDTAATRLVAARAAAAVGVRLFEMPVEDVPTAAAELDAFARLWQRESRLSPVGLLVAAADADRGGAAAGAVRRWARAGAGLLLLDVDEPWPALGDVPTVVDVGRPTAVEQRAAWADGLGGRARTRPDRLAGQFDLNLPDVRRIVRDALEGDPRPGDRELTGALWDGCLAQTRTGLDQLAHRVPTRSTWDDLEVPAEQERLLRQIENHMTLRSEVYDGFGFRERMNRGLGVSVLFSGESGTGKTMAAEVLASSLRLLLYRIDLSAVVSKYIGETEKNLRRLFDAAEGGGAILFFDEADALFGARSEVKDSHDRYANIEIDYLLQRMESFRGLAVLATNRRSAMDTAFLRRLRFAVDFPFPGVPQRRRIWERAFPEHTPRDVLDLDRLAVFTLSGGGIVNAALVAAFAAAATGPRGRVTMPLVLDAVRAEFRKLDRPVNEADFVWVEPEKAGSAR